MSRIGLKPAGKINRTMVNYFPSMGRLSPDFLSPEVEITLYSKLIRPEAFGTIMARYFRLECT